MLQKAAKDTLEQPKLQLALALFMLFFLTNHTQNTPAFDQLTISTNLLY